LFGVERDRRAAHDRGRRFAARWNGMTDYALLNNVDHHDLTIRIDDPALFGARVNQAPVWPSEFEDAARDYPIVLRRPDTGGALQAMALLGLDRDENLFLDDAGGWITRYVPAVLQRGPFRIGMVARDAGSTPEPMVHVDLDHPTIGRGGGVPLFLPQGGNAPYLDHVGQVLRRLHDGGAMAASLYAAWDEAGLIEPITLRLSLDETTRYDIPDCFTIGTAPLAALEGERLAALNRAGFLRPAFMLSASLGNVARLIERKNARRAAAAAA
jgi:hypothetical protein